MPYQLAIKNGIRPCDKETNQFYCVSCLDSSDIDHMLICTDNHHETDSCVANEIYSAQQYLKPDNFDNLDDFEEEEKMYRVQQCGQAFHIYCVPYPDEIWRRWCNFMKLQLKIYVFICILLIKCKFVFVIYIYLN